MKYAGPFMSALVGLLYGVGFLDSPRSDADEFTTPARWTYSAPLISPEPRARDRSYAQKDPSVVQHEGVWHVFMTVKLQDRSIIEHCAFREWQHANDAPRTLLKLSERDYYCAPQVFYFRPHKLWYLIYQVGVPGQKKMWVAYSTTDDLADPESWTPARPILDGGPDDPREQGGLDYWIICDERRAYLFYTTLDGRMWRLHTAIEDFPRGFDHCQVALKAKIFEASHTYRLRGQQKYLTLIEVNGQRYFKAYVADSLDGTWSPIADTAAQPFAGAANVRPGAGVNAWTDNISHGELIRDSNDETLTVDPHNLRFVFQGVRQKEKTGKPYSQWPWRIGLLDPVSSASQ